MNVKAFFKHLSKKGITLWKTIIIPCCALEDNKLGAQLKILTVPKFMGNYEKQYLKECTNAFFSLFSPEIFQKLEGHFLYVNASIHFWRQFAFIIIPQLSAQYESPIWKFKHSQSCKVRTTFSHHWKNLKGLQCHLGKHYKHRKVSLQTIKEKAE